MKPKAIAQSNFKTMNCNQSVLATYGSQYGISKELCFSLGLSFGGGMGKQGKTCGAATGAYMVIGLWSSQQSNDPSKQKEMAAVKVQEFNKLFEEKHNSTSCTELLGYNMSKPEGLEKIQEKDLFSAICPGLVGDAVEILEQILD